LADGFIINITGKNFNGDWGLGPIPNTQSPIPNTNRLNKKS